MQAPASTHHAVSVEVRDDAALRFEDVDRFEVEKRSREVSASDGYKFLVGFCIALVAYMVVYHLINENKVPIAAMSIQLLVSSTTIGGIWLSVRALGSTAFNQVLMALPLLCTSIMAALTETTIQIYLYHSFPDIMKHLRRKHEWCDWHSIQSNTCLAPRRDLGNLVVLIAAWSYMVLLVVPARTCFLVSPLLVLLYVVPVVAVGGDMGDYHKDAVYLVLLLILFIIAKHVSDRLRKQLCVMLQKERRALITEKIKRCRVELEVESLLQHKEHTDSQECMTLPSVVSSSHCQPTVVSSPAGLLSAVIAQRSNPIPCSADDCIPADYHVQVEGNAAPQQLRDVKPGQKVLCMDSLLCQPRYVEVQEIVESSSEGAEWTDISLSDGTCMTLTGDHTVQATCKGGSTCATAVSDLVPQWHSLRCVSVKDLIVQDICKSSVRPSSRVAVSVRGGQHNSVLVQPSDEYRGHFVAVGSADLWGYHDKNKMAGIEWSMASETSNPLPRSYSSPALMQGAAVAADNSHNTDSSRRAGSTNSNTSSISNVDFEIGSMAALSEKNRLSSSGFSSIGSQLHMKGTCRPCQFDSKGRSCRFGFMCNYCHGHGLITRGDKKKLAKRREELSL
eukprot:TRINITY_DN50626_c0_g1_i1.p1 TRINITY_DN50626_c0_g1~~TRINITY_DN50626_c0_g1_i1.p1  ORF type:complete len:619 (-),score=98.83 TRINITY_DN50626_c0_g1_i1:92-1948(-)